MKTKFFLIVFASILLVMVFSTFALAGLQTLVFSSRLFSVPAEQEFILENVIKPFERENHCIVSLQIMDDVTLLDRAELQQETGNITTDIVCAHVGRMPEWIDKGYIEDLTSDVKSWDDRNFSPTFEYGTNFEGKQYFVPVGADTYLTIANKKALDYLPSGADLDKLTWEDFAKWSNAIAKGEGEGKTVVTGIPMKSFIYQFGAISLSYGATFPDINTPEAIKAWEILVSMKDDFIPAVLTIDNCIDPMKREESWLSWMHCARAGSVYLSNETLYSLAPTPEGPAGIGSIAGVSGYGIMKGAPNKELAIKFLEYITRPDMQVKIAKGTGGFIPPVEEALNYLGDDPEDEIIAKAVMVLSKGRVSGVPSGEYTDWSAVKKVFDDVFVAMVLDGDGTVDTVLLNEAQAKLDALRK
jgi:multiple sugar transport system substrate-binding protein